MVLPSERTLPADSATSEYWMRVPMPIGPSCTFFAGLDAEQVNKRKGVPHQIRAHAMSSAMPIVQALFPEKLTGQSIQCISAGAFRKNDFVNCDDPLQNQCIGFAFQVGGFPKMQCSGGVGCTV